MTSLSENSRPLGRFNRFVLWLNYFAAIALLLSVLAAYISPRTFWPLAFLGIAFPVLFCINAAFILYWGLQARLQARLWALLSLTMLLASLNNFLGNAQFHFSDKIPDNNDIKILSYNCMLFDLYNWSHNAQSRSLIFNMLKEESPDILCLQEFYTSEEKSSYNNADTLPKFLRAHNLHAEYTTAIGRNHWGIATLTRYPIVRKGKIVFDTRSNNICIYTDVLVNHDTLRIYNMHLASISFGKKEYKLLNDLSKSQISDPELNGSKSIVRRLKNGFLTRASQAELIADHMASCTYKIIVCGDFNDTPSSFAYHMLSGNLKDAFRQSGSGIGKTYQGALPFLRIDYILHDKRISSYNYRKCPESLTDHYPITCYLHLKR